MSDKRLPFDAELRAWWNELDERRGDRAKLRHAKSPTEVMKLTGFHRLRSRVGKNVNPYPLAAIAGLLAHVKSDTGGASVGRYLATAGSDGLDGLSESRFRRLLGLEDRDDLYLQLLRALRQLGHAVPVSAFAESVYRWNDQTRHEWASGYYDALLKNEAPDPPADLSDRDHFRWAAKEWWADLQNHSGERAELERCGDDLHAVHLARGFHRLRRYAEKVGKDERKSRQQLAAVTAVLAHVRTPISDDALKARPTWRHGISLAELAASDGDRTAALRTGETPEDESDKEKRKTEFKARLKEDRFRRLLAAEDRRDLVRPLIRAVIQLNHEADVARLAEDVFFWNRKTRGHWAEDYYRIAKPE